MGGGEMERTSIKCEKKLKRKLGSNFQSAFNIFHELFMCRGRREGREVLFALKLQTGKKFRQHKVSLNCFFL